jgi:hypothetical protein
MIQLSEQLKPTAYDFDPDATTATNIAWVDMLDFEALMVGFVRTIGTSALTFLIRGSTASNGANPVTLKTITMAAQPDAVGDMALGEITSEDCNVSGVNYRYVSATLTFATGTDEAVVFYVRKGMYKKSGLAADIVA